MKIKFTSQYEIYRYPGSYKYYNNIHMNSSISPNAKMPSLYYYRYINKNLIHFRNIFWNFLYDTSSIYSINCIISKYDYYIILKLYSFVYMGLYIDNATGLRKYGFIKWLK